MTLKLAIFAFGMLTLTGCSGQKIDVVEMIKSGSIRVTEIEMLDIQMHLGLPSRKEVANARILWSSSSDDVVKTFVRAVGEAGKGELHRQHPGLIGQYFLRIRGSTGEDYYCIVSKYKDHKGTYFLIEGGGKGDANANNMTTYHSDVSKNFVEPFVNLLEQAVDNER